MAFPLDTSDDSIQWALPAEPATDMERDSDDAGMACSDGNEVLESFHG
jgi:hypothetical protein